MSFLRLPQCTFYASNQTSRAWLFPILELYANALNFMYMTCKFKFTNMVHLFPLTTLHHGHLTKSI